MQEFKSMKDQMHLAAQYLAAAAIHFVEKRDDDSHTNLGFDPESGRMSTRPLSDSGDTLSLNYNTFSLDWNSSTNVESIQLDGTSHKEILAWLTRLSQEKIGKSYTYSFHYDVPYSIADTTIFKMSDSVELTRLLQLRIRTQTILEQTLLENNIESEIRIWSHHFDTGAFTALPNTSDIAVGFGLAIPDTLSEEYYLYLSGYKGHDGISTQGFDSLTKGDWKDGDFKGAILPADHIEVSEGVLFFKEAIDQYKK
ncbi:MAG: hypothetical protein ACI9Y7_002264 [Dokdonia sp.]|jgi:hypothetical protein